MALALSLVAPIGAAEYLVADQATGRVLAFDAGSGKYSRTLVSGLGKPSALTWGPNSSVYVTDQIAGTVLKIDPQTGTSTIFASGIDRPGSIAYDEWANSLYVGELGDVAAAQFAHQVITFASNGAIILGATFDAGASGHAGIAVDIHGNIYVSGYSIDFEGSGHIRRFRSPWDFPAFESMGVFAPSPAPSQLLRGAAGLAFDYNGNLYAAGQTTGGAGAIVKYTIVNDVLVGESLFDAAIASPWGLQLLVEGSLAATSLGTAATPGMVYRYDVATGQRTQLLDLSFLGNFNSDGSIDAADIAAWRTSFGAGSAADADDDGDSDGADLLAWQRGLGGSAAFSPTGVLYYAGSPMASIPEPSSAMISLVLIAALAATLRLSP
jgi:DNA-binding beta-propeller fold protein YncE